MAAQNMGTKDRAGANELDIDEGGRKHSRSGVRQHARCCYCELILILLLMIRVTVGCSNGVRDMIECAETSVAANLPRHFCNDFIFVLAVVVSHSSDPTSCPAHSALS